MLTGTCDGVSVPPACVSRNNRRNNAICTESSALHVQARSIGSRDNSTGGGGVPRQSHPARGKAISTKSGGLLRPDQVQKFLRSVQYARLIGLPLNRFVTINWEAAGVTDAVRKTGRFLKLARDWLRRRGGGSAHVWVQECGPIVGQHAHILIHVSPDLVSAFSYRQRRWLTACGATFQLGIIRSRPIGRSYRHAAVGTQYGETYDSNLSAITQYMLKETDEETKRRFGLNTTTKGGVVYGKRIATSQNIGSAAQRQAAAQRAQAQLSRDCSRPLGSDEPAELLEATNPISRQEEYIDV